MKKYIFKYKTLFVFKCITKVLASILSIFLAFTFQYVIDTISEGNLEKLKIALAISIVYVIANFINKNIDGYLETMYLKKTMTNIKNEVFSKILAKDMNEFVSQNSGSYISTLTNDCRLIESDLLRQIFKLIECIVTFSIAVVVLLNVSIPMTLAVLSIGSITILIPNLFRNLLVKYKTEYSNNMEKFISSVKDFLSGFEIIKSYNISSKILSAFNKSINKVEDSKKNYYLCEIISASIGSLLGNSIFLFVMFFSGYLVIKNEITIGVVVQCTQLMNYITGAFIALVPIINRIRSTKNITDKFNKILSENNINTQYKELKTINKNIEFNNVSFSYDNNKDVLHNINLTIEKGKKYAIIGASGCGKSTLIKLLMGYYRNYSGEIIVDNEEFRNIDLNDFYNIVSCISQNVFVFDATIKDNITLFSDYSVDAVERVIEKSELKATIQDKAEGLYTQISEGGLNLSGGERQRIAIARALLKNVSMLVLDEATSALDNKTAYDIEKCILSIPDVTSVVVTHKLWKEILQEYDEIIVMKDGNIIETGTFNNLISKKGYFYNIYSIEEYR